MPDYRVIYLDSGPVGLMTRGRNVAISDECRQWAVDCVAAGQRVVVPEIIDYEVRREVLRRQATGALRRLDQIVTVLGAVYQPITTAAMLRAAELWADLRRGGIPTADPHALDADVILAAQLLTDGCDLATAVVATGNARHLGRMVNCQDWRNLTP